MAVMAKPNPNAYIIRKEAVKEFMASETAPEDIREIEECVKLFKKTLARTKRKKGKVGQKCD